MDVELVAAEIVDAALQIHRTVGHGLLESAYESMLQHELLQRGLRVERQKYIGLYYGRLHVERAYCVDLFVEESLLIEVKSVKKLDDSHIKQVVTYLRLSGHKTGFLINFGEATLKGGIRRLSNSRRS